MLTKALESAHHEMIGDRLEVQFSRPDDESRCVIVHVKQGFVQRPLMLLQETDHLLVECIARKHYGWRCVVVCYYAVINTVTNSLVVEHNIELDNVTTIVGKSNGAQKSVEIVRPLHHAAHVARESGAAGPDA